MWDSLSGGSSSSGVGVSLVSKPVDFLSLWSVGRVFEGLSSRRNVKPCFPQDSGVWFLGLGLLESVEF